MVSRQFGQLLLRSEGLDQTDHIWGHCRGRLGCLELEVLAAVLFGRRPVVDHGVQVQERSRVQLLLLLPY